MTIATVGVIGWSLVFTIAVRFGAAAKRGDQIAEATQRYLPVSHRHAQVIRFPTNPAA